VRPVGALFTLVCVRDCNVSIVLYSCKLLSYSERNKKLSVFENKASCVAGVTRSRCHILHVCGKQEVHAVFLPCLSKGVGRRYL
jgi:hypothetical protein